MSTPFPLLGKDEPLTKDYAKKLEVAIRSDGCTDIPQFHHNCCVVHDLAYRYAMDPWGVAVTRAQADANFRACMQKDSIFGRFDPMSWWRWAGVRIFGRWFYSAKERTVSSPSDAVLIGVSAPEVPKPTAPPTPEAPDKNTVKD